jgi:drug/metabolite transporter (DMT)-like permease
LASAVLGEDRRAAQEYGVTYGLIAALAWGISTIAAACAARRVGTYLALLVSQLLGAGFLGLLAVMMRPSLAGLDGLTLLGLVGAGLLSLVGWLTYYKALEGGPVGVVSAITATYGGVAAVLAVLVLGEHLGLSGGTGVILAVGGVGLVATRSGGGLAPGGVARTGILLALMSAATYGVGSFLLGGFSAQVGWLVAALVSHMSSLAALVLLLPFRRAVDGQPPGAAPPADLRHSASRDGELDTASPHRRPGYLPGLGWAAAAGLTEAVALSAFSRGGQAGQVAVTSAVSSLYPIIPLAAGLMVFHERVRWRQVLGVGCIVIGLVMISLGKVAGGTMLARGQDVMMASLAFVIVVLSLAGTGLIVVRVLRGKAAPQPVSRGPRAQAQVGDEYTAFHLAGLLKARGDLDGAEQILRARAHDGDRYATLELAGLLEDRGDLDGAEQILRARAHDGDRYATLELAGLLARRGDPDGAEQILRARAHPADQQAADRLAGLLAHRGDLDWFRAGTARPGQETTSTPSSS